MSFLGGPECSTGANPLSQFQKQTSADTSLQRDRLTSRQPNQLNGFRSQQGGPQDAAFQDFAQQGPQFGEPLPQDAFHFEQMRREAEHIQRSGDGTPMNGGAGGWAGEFAQQGPGPQEFAPQQRSRGAGFSPQDFANFRAQQGQGRTATPPFQQQNQSAFGGPQMYGGGMGMGMGGFGMQRPMFQSQFMGQQPGMQEQYAGKGKGKVQELSDTDWERQFEELTSQDREQVGKDYDAEAEAAMERELDQMDR